MRHAPAAAQRLLALAAFAALTAAAFPQFLVPEELLTPGEANRLNPAARELYDEGIERLDKIDYRAGLALWERASQAQPGHIDLAFLVAEMSKRLGRRSYGKEASDYYRQAHTAIERVLRRPDLDLATLRRAEQAKKIIDHEQASLAKRDERRFDVGVKLNLQVAEYLNLSPEVVTGSPRRAEPADPRQPFNLRTLAAEGPAGAGLGPVPGFGAGPGASPFGAAPGASPFGAPPPAAPPAGGGGSPFGAPAPAGGGGSPFGAPAPAAGGGGSPFGAPAPAGGGGSPFGAPAPSAGGGSPFGSAAAFGSAPATGNANNEFANDR